MTEVRDDRDRETEATVENGPNPEVIAEGQDRAAVEGAGGQASDDRAAGITGQVEGEAASENQYDELFPALEAGKIVKGRVVQVSEDAVMVDVGYKSEGHIPLNELGLHAGQKPSDVVNVGDEIDVFIIKVEDSEGNVLLSKRRADGRVVWEKLEKIQAAGETIEAQVTEKVKGGLLVDVGVRGFVPASQVSRNFVQDLDKFVGQTLSLRIVEIDRQRNNVVLSHKQVEEEEYAAAKEKAFTNLKEGAILTGVVRRIADFGAFIDLGDSVEGLLHVSEMAWSRVKHPSSVVKEGEEVKVMILNIDQEHGRISLSLKETLPDPWAQTAQKFAVGEVVEGEVTRVVDFGAFVKLAEGIEGLVHISQLADHRINHPSEVVQPGQTVQAKIVSIDEKARRIGLSVREAMPKPVREPREPRAPREPREPKQREKEQTTFGETGASTLGDRFPGLSDLLDKKQD